MHVAFGLLQEKTKREQKKRNSHRGRKPARSASLSSESSCSILVKEDNNQADERSDPDQKSFCHLDHMIHDDASTFVCVFLLRPPDPGETPHQAPCAPPPAEPAAPPPPPPPEPECLPTKQPSPKKMQGKKYGFMYQQAP